MKYNLENEDFLLMLHNELNGLKNLFGCTFTTPKKFHECNFSLIWGKDLSTHIVGLDISNHVYCLWPHWLWSVWLFSFIFLHSYIFNVSLRRKIVKAYAKRMYKIFIIHHYNYKWYLIKSVMYIHIAHCY